MSGTNISMLQAAVITNSFTAAYSAVVAAFPRSHRFVFNDVLLPNSRGLYIGGQQGSYDVYCELDGHQGVVVPFVALTVGVIHRISPRIIYYTANYPTNAPNILVLY